jgi:Fic family protein
LKRLPPNRCRTKWTHSYNGLTKLEPGQTQEINHAPIRSAIAHLYFESIHPFEDGNGRIGRALSEKALSQGLGHPILLSLSKTINQDRKGYYAALKKPKDQMKLHRGYSIF